MSASQKITLELTVAEAQAIAKLRAFDSMLTKMGGSMKGVGTAGNAAGKQLNSGFAAVQGSIGRAVKAFLSLNMGLRAMHTLVSGIRTELDKMKQYRASAADQEVEYSRLLKEFKMRMPAGDTMSLAAIDAIVREQSGTVPKNEIMGHVLKSLSAGSNMSTRERIQTGVEMAKVLEPFPQSEKEEVGASIQRMRENFGVTPTEAAGMFVQTMQSSTLTHPREVSEYIVSPANQLKKLGFGLEQGLELMAGAQMATEDPHGRMSRTMMLANLNRTYEKYGQAYNLKGMDIFDFMKAQGRFAPGGVGHEASVSWNKQLMGGLDEQVEKILERAKTDPEYAAGETGDLLSRGAIRTGAKSIFALAPVSGGAAYGTQEQSAHEEMMAARRQIESPSAAAATLTKRLELEPETAPYEVNRILGQLDKKLKDDRGQAIGGELDKLMDNITTKIGKRGAYFQDWRMSLQALVNTAPGEMEEGAIEGVVQTLQGLRREVHKGTGRFPTGMFMQPGSGSMPTPRAEELPYGDLTPLQQQRSDALQWAIEQLTEKLTVLTEATERNNAGMNGGNGRPVPVEVTNQPPAPPPLPETPPIGVGGAP